MIEIKKYVREEELPRESINILMQSVSNIIKSSKAIKKICSDALEQENEEGQIDPSEAIRLIHIFRTSLYEADLSLKEVQDTMEKVYASKEEDEQSKES